MSIRFICAALASIVLVSCGPKSETPTETAPATETAETPLETTEANFDPANGEMCGGIAGLVCDDESFCDMPVGDCIQIADAAGVCAEKPLFCTLEYNPVCGCDGETYSNACEANAEGVSVASTGTCPDQG